MATGDWLASVVDEELLKRYEGARLIPPHGLNQWRPLMGEVEPAPHVNERGLVLAHIA